MIQLTDFLERKLVRRFRSHDHDGNGFLQRRDFESAAVRMAEEFGHGPESPARQRLIEISLGLWEHLRKVADFDADDRISLEEYKAAFAAGMLETPESFDQSYVPYIDAVIDIADQDGAGRLTASDPTRWMGTLMRVPEQHGADNGKEGRTNTGGWSKKQKGATHLQGRACFILRVDYRADFGSLWFRESPDKDLEISCRGPLKRIRWCPRKRNAHE